MKNSRFQFSKPYVENIVFNASNDNSVNNKIEIRNEIGIKIDGFEKDENETRVSLDVKLGSFLPNSEEFNINGFPFYIQITMCANFKFEEVEDKDLIDELLKKNAPVLLLSYIRPIVHNLTSMSKFPPYDIPFLDFSDQNND